MYLFIVLHMPLNETKTVLCGQSYDFKVKYVHLHILPDFTARLGNGYFQLTILLVTLYLINQCI